jgi:hypothetical protein
VEVVRYLRKLLFREDNRLFDEGRIGFSVGQYAGPNLDTQASEIHGE